MICSNTRSIHYLSPPHNCPCVAGHSQYGVNLSVSWGNGSARCIQQRSWRWIYFVAFVICFKWYCKSYNTHVKSCNMRLTFIISPPHGRTQAVCQHRCQQFGVLWRNGSAKWKVNFILLQNLISGMFRSSWTAYFHLDLRWIVWDPSHTKSEQNPFKFSHYTRYLQKSQLAELLSTPPSCFPLCPSEVVGT